MNGQQQSAPGAGRAGGPRHLGDSLSAGGSGSGAAARAHPPVIFGEPAGVSIGTSPLLGARGH